MICRKCGGIYDDDMQKCMWCDAPNENPDQSTDAQEAETAESALQECEVCSKKAVFWPNSFCVSVCSLFYFYEFACFAERKSR